MNTILNCINEDNKIAKISVDLQLYEIEQTEEGTCIIVHKADSERWYEVKHSFNHLHLLTNGFDNSTLN